MEGIIFFKKINAIRQNNLDFDRIESLFGKTVQPYTLLLIPLKLLINKQTWMESHNKSTQRFLIKKHSNTWIE